MISNFDELIRKYGKTRDLPIEIVQDLKPIIDELLMEFRKECQKLTEQLIEEMEERARVIIASTYKRGEEYSETMISFIVKELKKKFNKPNGTWKYYYSYRDIAKRYGISVSAVNNIAIKNNLSRRKTNINN
jgi:iron-sulfur cluster repair protein YtfE (RIC family)